jgi:WD40 repeat protein/predicted Ser/Thr protein kinase
MELARGETQRQCPRCLLESIFAGGEAALEDRLFEQALTLDTEGRARLIEEAGRREPKLREALELLLQGYAEASAGSFAPGGEEAGGVIGNFRLARLIGQGGMGSVWEAEQTAPVRRKVALKLIKLGMDTRDVVRRFERERQTLALLTHPNIAQVYEAGATQLGRPYFVMELALGQPLTAWCEDRQLSVDERLKLFLEVCAAVEHAHQKGVIHRDLKPSNVLVADGRVKVIDFGVAKATQGAGDTLFTLHAQTLGTPGYMSPEQAQSAGADIDTRTDVYALGVVLYELLTGTLPIDAGRLSRSSAAEMQRILTQEEPPIPSSRISTLSAGGQVSADFFERRRRLKGDLDWVVMKAIRKDRNERYASVTALADDVRRYLEGEPVLAAPPTFSYRAGKFARRHRVAVAAAILVLGTLLAATSVSLWQATLARRAQRLAMLTVSDMYARSGLTAAAQGEASRGALWFANAAIEAGDDAARREANRVRAASFRREMRTPARALPTGFTYSGEMFWHPKGDALTVWNADATEALVWDLQADRLWQTGSAGRFEKAAWTPTGGQIAAVASNEVVVVSYPAGKLLARAPFDAVGSLAFSPDGGSLAVTAAASAVWNWQTGEQQLLPPMESAPSEAKFSANGKWLLLRSAKQVGICDARAPGRFIHGPDAARDSHPAMFLGEGERYFMSAPGGEGEARDSATGALAARLPATEHEPVPVIAASPDGRFVGRHQAEIFDLPTAARLPFPVHRNVLATLAFSHDGKLLASGGYDDALKLWSLPDGQFLGDVGRHQSAVLKLAFSPDDSALASAQEGLVRIWNIKPTPARLDIPANAMTLSALAPDGKSFVFSGFTHASAALNSARLHETETAAPLGPEILPGGLIMDAVLRDGWMALAVSTTTNRPSAKLMEQPTTGNLQFWNPRTGERLGEPLPLPAEPRGLAVHPDGKTVGVICGAGQGLEIDVASHEARLLFDHNKLDHAGATLVNGRCAYSPDGLTFAAWGLFQFAHLWNRAEKRDLMEPFHFDANCFDMAFAGNVAAFAWTSRTNKIEFLDAATGREAAPAIPQNGWPFLIKFNADGTLALTAGRDRAARVWDWRKGTLVCPVLPHDDEVMAGAFIPGQPWVATGGHDGAIKFWDYRSGMLMAPPVNMGGRVLELKITPDGRRLLASGYFGNGVALFDLEKLLPEPALDLENGRLLGEIEAAARVHPGGDVVPLSEEEWLARWKAFRAANPGFAGHRWPRP